MVDLYSYIRFSSAKQELGHSLKRQTGLLTSYLAKHPDCVLNPLSLRDLGVSAFRGANLDKQTGDLGKFIHLARQGKIKKGSILALEHLDRFSRDEAWLALNVLTDLLKCGIKVLTLEPERLIDTSNAGKMETLLPVVLDLIIAHEQSKRKSDTLSAVYRAKKENAKTGKIVTPTCPNWLTYNETTGKFDEVRHKADIIRQIYRLALEGYGSAAIERKFNAEGITLVASKNGKTRKSDSWHRSYIKKILANPAVKGVYQPCKGIKSNRKADGHPIAGYYPVIVKEGEWDRVQDAKAKRNNARGPSGKTCANLFSGLLYDPNGASMVINKRSADYARLVSSKALRGIKGTEYMSFPYYVFESHVLQYISGLNASDIADTPKEDNRLDEAQARFNTLASAIKKISLQLDSDPDNDTLIDRLTTLGKQKKETVLLIEKLKAQSNQLPLSQSLEEAQGIMELLDNAPQDDLTALRHRLKARIAQLVQRVIITIERGEKRTRTATLALTLTSGKTKHIRITHSGVKSASFGQTEVKGLVGFVAQ